MSVRVTMFWLDKFKKNKIVQLYDVALWVYEYTLNTQIWLFWINIRIYYKHAIHWPMITVEKIGSSQIRWKRDS